MKPRCKTAIWTRPKRPFGKSCRWIPGAGAAYANLGVIAMRRKDWDHALALLRKAEKLAPKMAGIRLNIGW